MPKSTKPVHIKNWREKLHEIIFEADTFEGKAFDVVLLFAIFLSIIAVCWESLPNLDGRTKSYLYAIEWVFTIFFTIEYIIRLITVKKPWKYATSFYGVIDLLSIIPTFLSLVIVGTNSLLILRALRLLRLFRIFKMVPYLDQGNIIIKSVRASMPKLIVFVSFIMIIVCISGAVMYLVEGSTNEDFDSIPRSIYWAIVTVTTVGFGDITPQTALGQFLSAILMIIGYAVIAVPTGIVSAEIVKGGSTHDDEPHEYSTQTCRYCSLEGHDTDAVHCKFCGEFLHAEDEPVTT